MVPLDGSELAERALPLAGQMAKAMGATIYLVRAVEAPAMWLAAPAAVYVPPTVYDDLLKNETEEAVSYLNRVREQLESSGLHVRADQCEGNPAVALLDYESAVNADLVVMWAEPLCPWFGGRPSGTARHRTRAAGAPVRRAGQPRTRRRPAGRIDAF